jgi:hypothetical protein
MRSLGRPRQMAQSMVEYVLLLGMIFILITFFTLTVSGNLLDSLNSIINNISF